MCCWVGEEVEEEEERLSRGLPRWAASPQTDGRTLWGPRGEIYLQMIQQKWKEGEGERADTEERESGYKWQREQEEGGQERSKD